MTNLLQFTLSLYAGNSKQNASQQCLVYHIFFVNFAFHPTPQKNLTELGLEIQTALSW
jgi:hypothetical protein